ncbi:hypothetical protein ACIQGA_33225 [[Kitasatospora] papulosa]|uniref:Uncharacterized protein n=1 Tax=Streptomyces pratensis (strain ATCC 33331 / IAF-45CD) TaxID=591167 RepID=A0A8D3WNH0_STRFA
MTTAAFSDDDGDPLEELRDTQDAVRRAADAVSASFADLLAPQREVARLARETLMPAIDASRFINEVLAPQRAFQGQMRAMMQDITSMQRLVVPNPLDGVLAQIRENQQQYQDTFSRLTDGLVPRIDTSFLDGLLHDTVPWQGLSGPGRDILAGVLDDARASVEAGEEREVPEEMVTELEEQAAQFATSAPGLLPPAAQKYLFAVFTAGMVMTTLMYVSVVSDAGNAVLDEVYQHGELAIIVFTAACLAWDRRQRNRGDDGGGD